MVWLRRLLAIVVLLVSPTMARAGAIPTYVNKGTFTSGTTSISVPMPASIVAGDLIIIFAESANETINTPSGYTQVSGSPQSTGTANAAGGVRLAVFYKVAVGGDTSVTVNGTTNHITGISMAFRGVSSSSPIHLTATKVDSTATTAMSWPTLTTTLANTLIINAAANDQDISGSAQVGSPTNASLGSLTERHDQTVSTGVGGGLVVTTGTKAVAGAVSATTATGASSVTHAYLTIALTAETAFVDARTESNPAPTDNFVVSEINVESFSEDNQAALDTTLDTNDGVESFSEDYAAPVDTLDDVYTPGAAGNNYTDPQTESVTPVDSFVLQGSYVSLWTEANPGPTDTFGVISSYVSPQSDSVTAGESFVASSTYPNARTEAVTAAESFVQSGTFPNSRTETVTAAESFTQIGTFPNARTETVATGDFLTNNVIWINAVSELVTALDSLNNQVTWSSTQVEAVVAASVLVDNLVGASSNFTDNVTETVTALESLGLVTVYVNTITQPNTLGDSSTNLMFFSNSRTEANTLNDSLGILSTYRDTHTATAIPTDDLAVSVLKQNLISEIVVITDQIVDAMLRAESITELNTLQEDLYHQLYLYEALVSGSLTPDMNLLVNGGISSDMQAKYVMSIRLVKPSILVLVDNNVLDVGLITPSIPIYLQKPVLNVKVTP
jgi:hypothetical protein